MADKERDKQELAYRASVTAEQAAEYLRSVVEGLRQRAMLAESGNDSIELSVAPEVKFEVDFNAGAKKSSIDISISWRPETPELVARPVLHVLSGRDLVDHNGIEFSDDSSNGATESGARANGAYPSKTAKADSDDEENAPRERPLSGVIATPSLAIGAVRATPAAKRKSATTGPKRGVHAGSPRGRSRASSAATATKRASSPRRAKAKKTTRASAKRR